MNDISKMSDTDLAEFIRTERETVREQRFTTGLRDVRKIRTAKKHVAQALTEVTRRVKATR